MVIRHAIFLEPHDGLSRAVLFWKGRLLSRWPRAVYGSHPPHLSVWVGPLRDASEAFARVGEKAASWTLPDRRIQGPHVFRHDALAEGGHTLAYRIHLTKSLMEFQAAVAMDLADWVDRGRLKPLPPGLAHGPFAQSQARYGFPFVGAHWIPHVSVGAVPAEGGEPFVDEFVATGMDALPGNGGERDGSDRPFGPWASVLAVRIQGDHHEVLSRWPLILPGV